MLIARAVYKNPEFIFFDEATNSLDSNNEKIIMQNLHEFYKGKTVVVVAHRLSTVKDADKIIVLDKGKVIEEGTHAELTQKRGAYYPYSEYGYVTGVINCINETPDENGNYLITVAFPDGMKSSYGHNLRAWKVMTGTAEIIIENKRLTEKLLQSFNLIKR